MRFRRDAPLVVLGAAAAVLASLTGFSNHLFAAQMASVDEEQFALMHAIVDFNVKSAQDRALARADEIVNLPGVRDALAARDRPRLLAETQAMYESQHEKYGLDQAMFSVPPATSFLRLNAPTRFDEDLSEIRPMVVTVNRDHVAASGISIGRSGPALFGVVPVFDRQDQPIGAFEMGLDFGPMLDRLKAAYRFDSAFFVREEPLQRIATGIPRSVFDVHSRVGQFLKYNATNWQLVRGVVTGEDLARIDGEIIRYAREVRGVTYGVVLVPIRNAAGDSVGVIAAVRDFSPVRASVGRAIASQISLAVFGFLLLTAIVLVVVRGFLLRPLRELNAGLGALAEGRAAPALEDTDVYCEEVREAAARYETLRARLAPGEGEPS